MTFDNPNTLLAHECILGREHPKRWIFFVHGFLGKGQNWRTFARRLVAQIEGLGAVLVDLRLHGESKSMMPPHTIESAALDLVQLKSKFKEPVSAILGHSFGAKIALKYVAYGHEELAHAFLIDFVPWALKDKQNASQTYNILNMMISLKDEHFEARDEFIYVLGQKGISKALAQWLSMNGRSNSQGFELAFDAEGMKALLDDYYAKDLMSVLEKAELQTKIHVVLGGESTLLSEQDRERLVKLPSTHIIEHAGHDVHMDAPDKLLEVVSGYFYC